MEQTASCSRTLGPGKTRTHCGGNFVSCDVARPWQNAALLRAARTQQMFLKIFRNILCPGHKICVGQKCCARGKTSQHLGNMITCQCCRHNVSSFCWGFSYLRGQRDGNPLWRSGPCPRVQDLDIHGIWEEEGRMQGNEMKFKQMSGNGQLFSCQWQWNIEYL